jgi:hypothetical protein
LKFRGSTTQPPFPIAYPRSKLYRFQVDYDNSPLHFVGLTAKDLNSVSIAQSIALGLRPRLS